MNRLHLSALLLFFFFPLAALADGIDDLQEALRLSSLRQVQEKVYVHTDNQCYFVGDTLWYKAYVVRADNLRPTDMSRILYVELLSPDGLLVERQQIVVSADGFTCGQFALQDSLYSGYYELRAYTRWMLNFNVRQHRYARHDSWLFYNARMAADYFRVWDGLYSRVFPLYSKPEKPGDYDARRMYQRPKTRLPQVKKDNLIVSFFPEGGHLVDGVENRVAFSVTDQHGEAVQLSGTVTAAGMQPITVKTEHGGRGSFMVTPSGKPLKAQFAWRGKQYSFDLPEVEGQGVALRLDGDRLSLRFCGVDMSRCAVSVLCRGALKFFERARQDLTLPLDSFPTGVCDVTLFTDGGQILADRLFFVNHHDQDAQLVTTDVPANRTFASYERIEYPVQCQGITAPTHISLAIRDTQTDEPTYDNGNVMTDLLLSSDLRGFIARPAYYFEADDAQHRRHLDLLMLVQGWRKYKWRELADTTRHMRYEPERTFTVEGSVYKMLDITEVQPDEIPRWQDGVGMTGRSVFGDQADADPFAESSGDDGTTASTSAGTAGFGDMELGSIGEANAHLGVDHGNLRHEVLVEAEVAVGGQFAGSVQTTENGRFLFQIPPFYGSGYLNIKAYSQRDSLKKNMSSRKDAKVMNEDEFPDYYVKRDLFFPVYTSPYDFYQNHAPDFEVEMLVDTLSELSMENDVHQLGNVNVKGRRRGRRAIDYSKPAYVVDAYDIYNEATDRGLSFGKFDMRQFPVQICRLLFGNMGRYNSFHVDGRVEGATYYRNYSPTDRSLTSAASSALSEFNAAHGFDELEQSRVFKANRTGQYLYNRLKLKRLQDIRVFTDYEPRIEDSTLVQERFSADATVEMVPIADDGVQVTYRDRHLVLHGFNMPEQFYQPDYGSSIPVAPTDYRRTLYWNPNAVTDEQGRFTAVFYNGSKPSRIKMSAAGVTGDGRLLHSK